MYEHVAKELSEIATIYSLLIPVFALVKLLAVFKLRAERRKHFHYIVIDIVFLRCLKNVSNLSRIGVFAHMGLLNTKTHSQYTDVS